MTKNQKALLKAIITSQYVDSSEKIRTYAWDALENSGLDRASFGGTVAKAVEAGLITHNKSQNFVNGRMVDDSTVTLTPRGVKAARHAVTFDKFVARLRAKTVAA